MKKLCDAVVPITAGDSDGNGVVVGNLLITAAHVANRFATLRVNINGDIYTLEKKDTILCIEENHNNKGLFYDCAIYLLPKYYNNLSISRAVPNIGCVLDNISRKHLMINKPNSGIGFFVTTYEDDYKLYISKATVVDVIGDFIVCNMDIPLEEGRSGSPLFFGEQVVGILHGGINGKACVFQLINSLAHRVLCKD